MFSSSVDKCFVGPIVCFNCHLLAVPKTVFQRLFGLLLNDTGFRKEIISKPQKERREIYFKKMYLVLGTGLMGLILCSRNLKQIRLLPMSKPLYQAFLISLSSPDRPGGEPWPDCPSHCLLIKRMLSVAARAWLVLAKETKLLEVEKELCRRGTVPYIPSHRY